MTLPQIYQQPNQVYYATTWPKDLEKWLEFEDSFSTLGKNPLTYIPEPKADKKIDEIYQLLPLSVREKERIPLTLLETNLRNWMIRILNNQEVTDEDRRIKTFFHRNFFDWIKLSLDKSYLEIEGPLPSWEILGYMRARLNDACQDKKLSYRAFMYPTLNDSVFRVHPQKAMLGLGIFSIQSNLPYCKKILEDQPERSIKPN